MKLFVIIAFLCLISCSNDKKEIKLATFFKSTSWKEFNKQTFTRNNLSHLLKNQVDFYDRESFFNFMSNLNENIFYQNFYLIETFSTDTESTINKKILVLNNHGKIKYLGFKKGRKWTLYEVTDKEKKDFQYIKLSSGVEKIDDSYLLITKIIGLKY